MICYQNGGENAYNYSTVTILINNSIHAGEPDGTDACMLLLRDIAVGKIKIPDNIRLAVIPVYNIGGALNRGSFSRVNQNGPDAYGFRGNSQNLDLNRDFTKCDSREALSFAQIFEFLNPNVFIDNHVSDGADYQHTMTLLSTQYDKLGGETGMLMRKRLDPAIYKAMARKGWLMIPYVNAEGTDPRKGWTAFYDPPRYSAGYASLFHTIAYTPETHMLKPFKQRVESTYALMRIIINKTSKNAAAIKAAIHTDQLAEARQTAFPLSWAADTTKPTFYSFMGYETAMKTSEVTGLQRLYYDRQKPYTAQIPIYDHYLPKHFVTAPKAYIIPGIFWWNFLQHQMNLHDFSGTALKNDTFISVTSYHLDDYKTVATPFEGHYKHYDIKVTPRRERILCRKGDVILELATPPATDEHLVFHKAYPGRRFMVEMLEPAGDDSYFAWNFFDAILQQKEGYSDYRWEDVAADFLKRNPDVRQELEAKKKEDAAFAKDAAAQLRFVYRHSPYYEPEHLRYPVFRIE